MKYNFWNSFGFLILMSFFLVAGYSNAKAQSMQTTCGHKKADKLLLQGQAEYDKKDYPQAVNFYDQAAKAAPKCPVPYFQKGLALMDTKKYDDAVIVFQEALKRNYSETFRLYMGICQARYEQGNFAEAAKNCEESARLNDNFYWTFWYLALSQVSLNNIDKALPAVRRASELDPKSTDALILKARILNSLKKYDEAIIDITAAVKLNPNSDEAFFLLGANYFLLKNYAKSVEYLTKSVKLNRDNFEAWLLLTSAYIGDSLNWEKAEEAAFQAVRIKPNDGDANFQLALAQLITGRLEAAVKSFDTAIKNKNDLVASALVFKGYALIGLKRVAEAEKIFEQALSVKPINKVDYLALAEIYYYRWELDKAREQIKKGIDFATDDEDWQEYSSLSWSYSLSNEPQQAIIAANEAIQLNPTNDLGYTNRCRAYNETNLPDIAIKDCQKALEIKPNDGEVFFYLGRAYGLKKDVTQEKSYNQKAISLMEKRLGVSFNSQKDGQLAKNSTDSTSATNNGKVSINSPAYTYYLYLLGNAYSLDKNFEAAISAYQKVLELRPNFPRLRYNLAASYLSLKRPDLKNADAQYTALLLIDSKLAADLKKIINGFRRKK
jgi:tetratricopeptide (TPR) repeat protein